MAVIQRCNEWKLMVEPVLVSKAAELQLMGYSQATAGDVWKCLAVKVWKGNPEKRIHEIVQDIFHLDSGIYLSYLTIQSYQNDDLMASIAALTGSNGA